MVGYQHFGDTTKFVDDAGTDTVSRGQSRPPSGGQTTAANVIPLFYRPLMHIATLPHELDVPKVVPQSAASTVYSGHPNFPPAKSAGSAIFDMKANPMFSSFRISDPKAPAAKSHKSITKTSACRPRTLRRILSKPANPKAAISVADTPSLAHDPATRSSTTAGPPFHCPQQSSCPPQWLPYDPRALQPSPKKTRISNRRLAAQALPSQCPPPTTLRSSLRDPRVSPPVAQSCFPSASVTEDLICLGSESGRSQPHQPCAEITAAEDAQANDEARKKDRIRNLSQETRNAVEDLRETVEGSNNTVNHQAVEGPRDVATQFCGKEVRVAEQLKTAVLPRKLSPVHLPPTPEQQEHYMAAWKRTKERWQPQYREVTIYEDAARRCGASAGGRAAARKSTSNNRSDGKESRVTLVQEAPAGGSRATLTPPAMPSAPTMRMSAPKSATVLANAKQPSEGRAGKRKRQAISGSTAKIASAKRRRITEGRLEAQSSVEPNRDNGVARMPADPTMSKHEGVSLSSSHSHSERKVVGSASQSLVATAKTVQRAPTYTQSPAETRTAVYTADVHSLERTTEIPMPVMAGTFSLDVISEVGSFPTRDVGMHLQEHGEQTEATPENAQQEEDDDADLFGDYDEVSNL